MVVLLIQIDDRGVTGQRDVTIITTVNRDEPRRYQPHGVSPMAPTLENVSREALAAGSRAKEETSGKRGATNRRLAPSRSRFDAQAVKVSVMGQTV